MTNDLGVDAEDQQAPSAGAGAGMEGDIFLRHATALRESVQAIPRPKPDFLGDAALVQFIMVILGATLIVSLAVAQHVMYGGWFPPFQVLWQH